MASCGRNGLKDVLLDIISNMLKVQQESDEPEFEHMTDLVHFVLEGRK